jgi:DNA-binding NtrC family response regulator
VLLDEITEMPAELQARLVHVLQNNEFRKPGNAGTISGDVRILASTSTNLDRALAEKKLREDLYYRLSAFTVHVPPLRQRKDEIAILLRYLMHRMARYYGLPARELPNSVLEACQQHPWPGNLGELETFVKRFLVAGDRDLTLREMEFDSVGHQAHHAIASHAPMRAATEPYEEKSGQAQPGQKSLKSLVQSIKCEAERNAISAALEKTGWNRKAAARDLKVSYRTLLYKIEQYRMTASVPSLSTQPFEELVVHANGTKGHGR